MTIKVTYNVTDVYMSQSVSPVYINVSYSDGGASGGGVWGSITGTLSDQTDLQTALDLKVPYSGATGNVNIGEYELKAGQVTLDTSPTGTAAVGTIRWNDTTGTSETTLKGGNVIIKNGVDLVARVVNKVSPNTTLTKAAYQAVRVSGAQGQRLAIELAQANNDAGSADTIGLVTETIAPNQEGFIMTVGQLEGINTTGSLQGETWVDGDVLYLSPTTAGAVTNVKPTAVTGHIVVIGYVEYAHVNNGKIYVKVMNGWELDELHNVSIVTPSDNQGLFYNSTSTLWENKSITTALGYTPVPTTRNITINGVTYDLSADRTYTISTGISGSGASGQVTYWTGASAVSGSNNLFWDNTNGRLGIGTNAPTESMQVVAGNILIDNNRAIRTKNTSGSTLDIIKIDTSNNLLLGSLFFGGAFYLYTNTSFRWFQYPSSVATERMQLSTSGNLLIGSTADNGQRLQVYGDTLLRGSGNTSATTALTVQNSSSTNIITIKNNRTSNIISDSGQLNIASSADATWGLMEFDANSSATQTVFVQLTRGTVGFASTAINQTAVRINGGFAPTSGTATWHSLHVNPTINQTGGANGITRGLYVNPTLTAAADWRSIEWSNNTGWGLYGAGTANNYLAGSLGIGSTSLTVTNLRISKNIEGGTSAYGVLLDSSIRSGVTSQALGFTSSPSIQNSAFTVSQLRHFYAIGISSAGSATITNQSGFYVENSFTGATNNYGFISDIPSGTGRWNLYMSGTADNYLAGNLGIGITPTVRLHVSGDTILRGSGATSATTALTVQNSSSTNLFRVRNDGNTFTNAGCYIGASNSNTIIPSDANNSFSASGLNLNILFGSFQTAGFGVSIQGFNSGTRSATSGASGTLNIAHGFAPTSGTGTYTMLNIVGTINQTGGANGITRGLLIAPTLTSAADFRAIETTNGKIVFGNLPTSSAGLPTGALWNDAGTVKIV